MPCITPLHAKPDPDLRTANFSHGFFAPLLHLLPQAKYAGDGHFHGAAAHDPRDAEDGTKYAVGHFFSLNLRTHALGHLSIADQIERKKEHDMRALKRLSVETLRQGAARGGKVIMVWDRAGIDFRQWHEWKHTGGLYFLSREPSGAR